MLLRGPSPFERPFTPLAAEVPVEVPAAAVVDGFCEARGGEGVPFKAAEGGRFNFGCGMPGRAVPTAAMVKIA